jgi:hypothetical protein
MFIALRPCKFDKKYFIGDTIPDEVVDKKAITRLTAAGIIAVAKGANTPSLATTDTETAHEEVAPSDTEKEEDGVPKLTKSQLEKLNREKLVKYAESMGVATDADMTKKEIIEAVIGVEEE